MGNARGSIGIVIISSLALALMLARAGRCVEVGAPASAQPTGHVGRTLWIDPTAIDVTDPDTLKAILGMSIDRLILSALVDGRSIITLGGTILPLNSWRP